VAEYRATAMTIVDGARHGQSYTGFGGMFAVTEEEGPRLRWLAEEPYGVDEPIVAAIQSAPMLIAQDGALVYQEDEGRPSRRTAIATDRQGRVLILVAPYGGYTLGELAATIAGSDLDVGSALNLDGGASTGLMISDPREEFPAFSLLPVVITVSPREP
jgi:hypothetical protein